MGTLLTMLVWCTDDGLRVLWTFRKEISERQLIKKLTLYTAQWCPTRSDEHEWQEMLQHPDVYYRAHDQRKRPVPGECPPRMSVRGRDSPALVSRAAVPAEDTRSAAVRPRSTGAACLHAVPGQSTGRWGGSRARSRHVQRQLLRTARAGGGRWLGRCMVRTDVPNGAPEAEARRRFPRGPEADPAPSP